jgi:hypothetical protein
LPTHSLALAPMERNGDKSVNAEETLPLIPDRRLGLRTARYVTGVLAGPKAVGRCIAAAGHVLTCVASGNKRIDSIGSCVTMKMSPHALIRGEIACDLKKLDAKQHGYPR